jgi:hypothetical protein
VLDHPVGQDRSGQVANDLVNVHDDTTANSWMPRIKQARAPVRNNAGDGPFPTSGALRHYFSQIANRSESVSKLG